LSIRHFIDLTFRNATYGVHSDDVMVPCNIRNSIPVWQSSKGVRFQRSRVIAYTTLAHWLWQWNSRKCEYLTDTITVFRVYV